MLWTRKKLDQNEQELLKSLVLNRSRIAKKAVAKIESVVNILDCNFKEGEHWLVYCEDTDQMDQIRDQLNFKGYKPFTYSSGDKNRDDQLRGFIAKGGIMLSMRCLDEGVDIPIISHAVIASSSRNPRQFIQRRGRVLRRHEGKDVAYIWDCLTLPGKLDTSAYCGQIKQEVSRALEFASDALNCTVAEAVINRALIALGENPSEYLSKAIDHLDESNEYD